MSINQNFLFHFFRFQGTFNNEKYRFGFNGLKKDNEVAGAGNTNFAMYWEYYTRLGRRWNLGTEGSLDLSAYSCYSENDFSTFFNYKESGTVTKTED